MHKPQKYRFYSIGTCATSPSSSVKTSEKCDFPPFLTFARSTIARLKNELFRDVQWSQKKEDTFMCDNNKREKLEFLQMFFVKSFFISFFFLLLATLLCITMHDFQLAFVDKYFKMEAEEYNYMVVFLLGLWKILIFQFTLVPALVIWCIRKCCKCECKTGE